MANSVTDADFDSAVMKADLPVLVDFWAPWCGPCKAMLPIFEELTSEYGGKVKFVKMNVDENAEIPNKYGIMSIPTFMIFKDGKVASQFVGAKSKADMVKEIAKVVS